MRPTFAALALTTLLALGAAAPGGAGRRHTGADGALPARMADTGGGSQLITAEAPGPGATSGTLTWWDRTDGHWRATGSAPARFGSHGLAEGATREQGTGTTPTGLFALPYAFGIRPAPAGTRIPYRGVGEDSWWCEDNASGAYNRWSEPLAADCRAAESERLASYDPQYAYALVVAFNYDRPVRGRGAGIFLHVNGRAATAGCVSVPEPAMRSILRWAQPDRHPHLAIGTHAGPLALTRY